MTKVPNVAILTYSTLFSTISINRYDYVKNWCIMADFELLTAVINKVAQILEGLSYKVCSTIPLNFFPFLLFIQVFGYRHCTPRGYSKSPLKEPPYFRVRPAKVLKDSYILYIAESVDAE